MLKNSARFRLKHVGATAMAIVGLSVLSTPQAHAANIITFGDNANSCGGSVLCSTNGTLGYLNNGTGVAFHLSSITSWFQIDTTGVNQLLATQTMAEPDGGSGAFRVVNDTGAAVTSFSLALTDTFNSSTASVTCSGGVCVDNFQAQGGSLAHFNTELSGPGWVGCTQGTTIGSTCQGNSGGVAANFSDASSRTVIYTWSGASIAANAYFDITFASWNNTVYVNAVPEPETYAMLLAGLGLLGFAARRRKQNAA